MKEIWKDIPEYEGMYQVSDRGRVRSLDRVDTNGRRRKGKLLNPNLRPDGCYFEVRLSKSDGGRTWCVHQLVTLAFFGLPAAGVEVCHGKKGSHNNAVDNLRYGTSKENSTDTIKAGNTTAKAVTREDGKKYSSMQEAAKDNKCSVALICLACKGKVETAKGIRWSYA